MANSWIHSAASARHFKAGTAADYHPIHLFIDQYKSQVGDVRHRAFLHHSNGPFMVEQHFGPFITVKDREGNDVQILTRDIAESHIIEDLGWLPSPADWVSCMSCAVWMGGKSQKFVGREELLDSSVTVPNPTRGPGHVVGESVLFDVEQGREGGPRGMAERRQAAIAEPPATS